MSLTIQPLTPRYEAAYDRFLRRRSTSLLYYSTQYRDLIEDLLECKSMYHIAVCQGEVRGILPLMCKSGAYGQVLNSLPFYGSNGGVLAEDDEARRLLIDCFEQLSSEVNVCAATLIENPLETLEHPPKYDMLDERVGQFTRLDFAGDERAFLKKIDASARRNIRKAEKLGVSVKVNNSGFAMDFVLETHRENMRVIGGKKKSPAFFTSIPRFFHPGRDYAIYVAEIENELISALMLFYFNETVEYFTPATKMEHRGNQPMAAILFKAMLDASRMGYKRWNWGGTWLTQDGVYRFKKKWGAEDFHYRYFVRVRDESLLKASKDQLLREYPDFYVLPFDTLEGEANGK